MGEIADGITNGEMCGECMSGLSEEYGYPIVCIDCWETVIKKALKNKKESHLVYENGKVVMINGFQKANE